MAKPKDDAKDVKRENRNEDRLGEQSGNPEDIRTPETNEQGRSGGHASEDDSSDR